jgi:sialate O-acetylesterase
MLNPTRALSSPCAAAALAFLAFTAHADVTLPALIGDGMVLQRNTRASVWGWAAPREEVRVSCAWDPRAPPVEVKGTADEHGRWRVFLPTPDAGGPFTVTIAGRDSSRTLRDVMVGDVWICSGQSNMEWPLSAIGPGSDTIPSAEKEIAAANHPAIRLFTVPNTMSAHERIDVDGARWRVCAPATAQGFSAVGYFFGRELNERLRVPIGLIDADWGGTVVQAWMSAESLKPFDEFAGDLEYLATLRLDPAGREAKLKGQGGDWWSRLDAASRVDAGWAAPDFDDSAWPQTAVPATWTGDLGIFDGVAYFRRVIDVPEQLPSWAAGECVLELGPIDDYDDTYINGVRVGFTHEDNQWSAPRRYVVPAGTLKRGLNVVAVRVLDTAGPGGINGSKDQLVLRAKGSDDMVPLAGQWRYRIGAKVSALPPRGETTRVNPNTPTILFNGMIRPLTPCTIRGVIWYQGESNRYDPAQYARLFPAMIRDWRRTWAADGNAESSGNADFPFYFVQIAPFRYAGDSGQTSLLREAQASALALPNTGMAVTLDLGEATDIHPKNKLDVGRRLARQALAGTYHVSGVEATGPIYASMAVDGSRARITFAHVTGGLVGRKGSGKDLDGFLIAGDDRQFHVAHAEIDGDLVVVTSPRVNAPTAVRYAWSQVPPASLFNAEGLPVPPFRTDDWQGPLSPPEDLGRTEFLTDDPAFTTLFNGTDLAGWVNVNCSPATWSVRNGRIFCTGTPTGVLRSDRMYENFVLELEWRHLAPGGNSGLFVWSDALTARGQPFTRSVEVQVMDGQEGNGYTSDGDIFPIHGARMTPENGRGGDRAFPVERRARFSPEWNHYRVECVNGAVSLAINGKMVTRGREVSPRKGYLCLESEGSPIEFRNLRIKELPASSSLTPEMTASPDEGFVSILTGDLAGWKMTKENEGHWRVDDWTINFDGQGTDLWSEKSYKDFVLIADWRWSGPAHDADLPIILPTGEYQLGPDGKQATARVKEAGDSGIYLRGSSKSQVNMWCWPIGSGEVYGYRTDASMPAEVKAGVTPKVAADAPLGQWNRFVITMKGDRLTVVLNGKTVIEDARLPGVPEEGPIALQAHGSPVQFGNLYIKELK